MMIPLPRFASLVCAAVLTAGCAGQTAAEPQNSVAAPAAQSCDFRPGTWYDPATGQPLAPQEVLLRAKNAPVVLLGESHVIADHHRWQLQTLAQLHAQRPDMILGFESFPRRVQPVLDAWVAGELTEKEFLKKSEWDSVWRYDAQLYLPLFHFARLNHIPMAALNVDRSFLTKVSQTGWKNIPAEERQGLGDPAPAPEGYLAMLGMSFGDHGDGNGEPNGAPKRPGLEDPRFANFVDVQLTWDRAMAEAAAQALERYRTQTTREAQLVAIIGRGHMDFGYGVPHQLTDLGVRDVTVLLPWDALRSCDDLDTRVHPPVADAIFALAATRDYLPQPGPKLGVLIEAAEGGVTVTEVLEDSIAKSAGVMSGDLIIAAAGQPVAAPADVVGAVAAMAPGTWLPLRIKRGKKELDITARFPVKTDGAHQP